MSVTCPIHLVQLAQRLVDAGGAAIRRYFRAPLTVDDKPDSSPVTQADREAESIIRAILNDQRPEDGVLGEEFGGKSLDSEYVWVIDPIDGTKSFITGRPIFGTLVALLHEGVPILGVIDQPITKDRWIGAAGRPTTLNGVPTKVRPCAGLSAATLCTTSPDLFSDSERIAFQRLTAKTKITIYGGDCYAYGLLASGFQDVIVESGLKLYDFAALAPVVTGAGGIITDWSGAPLHAGSDGRVIASGDARLHAETLAVLHGHTR
ncbi:inositol-phosphate phosphatase / L-galactose 1-phosphate phosphatase / histidinol-phosphatase [Azospirillaceae bacterium]